MRSRSRPTIVLFSAPGTLRGIDPLIRRAGPRLVRLVSQKGRRIDAAVWMHRLLRAPGPDTVVVTSRTAVVAGVRPWRRTSGPFPRALEFWAVGPGTAQALREAGVRRVHRPRTVGAVAIARALYRRARRRVVYFRSDVAGSRLALALRGQGHRVVDLVVYRLQESPPLPTRARRDLSGADLLVVTSPSGLVDLGRRLDPPTFARLTRTARLVVLGERSRCTAHGQGFRHISVAPSTTAQRFTRHLLRELRDART